MNDIERHRAMSEASGRTRSQMRCDSCKFWSAGERCNKAYSPFYSSKTTGEAFCQQWERKK